ncbi:MAG: drug/metabolite transporter (DMT)-like permease [Flavobacteriales bacterium]|jgi:drug/metabolite transporter (DMT)-like permease
MPVLPTYTKGILITALGVLVISPDGLLTRLITTDHWTLIFWRTLLMAFGMWILCAFIYPKNTWAKYKELGSSGMAMVALYSMGSIAFIVAITHTSVANTLIILSTTPLSAVLIGRVFLGERIAARSWSAIVLVCIGVLVMSSDKSSANTSLFGDIAALMGAFFLAAGFTMVRRFPSIPIFPALSTSGLVTALLVLPLAQPLSISQQDFGYLLIMGVCMLPVGTGLMFLGPRYIPAAEVGLMLLLESILGPIWVWLVLSEHPGTRSFIGGAIILSTLVINAIWVMRSTKSEVMKGAV